MMNFALFVMESRKRAGLQQKELAERLGISAQYMSDIEAGRRAPDSDTFLTRVALALEVNRDLVYFAAHRLPPDIAALSPSEALIGAAFDEMRLICGIPAKH